MSAMGEQWLTPPPQPSPTIDTLFDAEPPFFRGDDELDSHVVDLDDDVPESLEEAERHSSVEELLMKHGMTVPDLPPLTWTSHLSATGPTLFISSDTDGSLSEIGDEAAMQALVDDSAFWSMSEDF